MTKTAATPPSPGPVGETIDRLIRQSALRPGDELPKQDVHQVSGNAKPDDVEDPWDNLPV